MKPLKTIPRISWVILLGVAPWWCASVPAHAEPPRAGFENIFNGRDLDGWVVEGTKEHKQGGEVRPVWRVAEGVIRCDGSGFGFLRYDQEVADFVFQVEYSMAKGCNSGIGIRGTRFTGPRETRPSFAGYEVQLLDDSGQPPTAHCSGSLYRYVAPSANPVKPAPEWNQIEIACRGSRIRVTINGVLVQDVDQESIPAIRKKPLTGFVSLQNHGGQIHFRNVRLNVLVNPNQDEESSN